MRVSLITTGMMEFRGLARALGRMFPSHEFHVESHVPGQPFNGFTSSKVKELTSTDPPGLAAKLLEAALGSVKAASEKEIRSDLALILEDMELVNKGNEAVVIEHVRESARRVLRNLRSPADPAQVSRLLKEHVSFHFAAPMPESWFFADPAVLATELDAKRLPPRLSPGRDLEDFLTDDKEYEADSGDDCSAWITGNSGREPVVNSRHKPRRPPWLVDRRVEHPKAYLQWLARSPQDADCTRYKETQEGVRLLGRISWATVLAAPNSFPFLRALVRDLEDALGTAAQGVPAGGMECQLTSRSLLPPNPLLRNL